MATASEFRLLSPDEYLALEQESEVKHEFVNGLILAQAGASRAHNLIALSLAARITQHLNGKPCRAYMSDMKLRVKTEQIDAFYYPDVMVSCDPNPPSDYFENKPSVIIEVLSETTRSKDKLEKLNAYTQLSSLKEYMIIEPKSIFVAMWRKVAKGLEYYEFNETDSVTFESIDLAFPMAEIYEPVLGMIQED